jgi:hypothetical protein
VVHDPKSRDIRPVPGYRAACCYAVYTECCETLGKPIQPENRAKIAAPLLDEAWNLWNLRKSEIIRLYYHKTGSRLIRVNTDNLKSTIDCFLEKSVTFQEVGDIFKLRYIVLSVAAIFNEQRKNVIVFSASVLGIKFSQIFKDYTPCSYFFGRIFHPWDGLSTRITILQCACVSSHDISPYKYPFIFSW